jgi:hypothetical protein
MALWLGRAFVGVDLHEENLGIARERCGAAVRQIGIVRSHLSQDDSQPRCASGAQFDLIRNGLK